MNPKHDEAPAMDNGQQEKKAVTGLFFNILPVNRFLPQDEALPEPCEENPLPEFSDSYQPVPLTQKPRKEILLSDCTTLSAPDGNSRSLLSADGNHRAEETMRVMDHIHRMLAPLTGCCLKISACTMQFWCSNNQGMPSATWESFHRFTLKVQHDNETGRPEVVITYDDIGHILRRSISALQCLGPDTRMFRQVFFRGEIFGWDDLPCAAHYHPDEMYPVMNPLVTAWLGAKVSFKKRHISCSSRYQLIAGFVEKYCMNELFRAAIPHKGCFKPVAAHHMGQLSKSLPVLQFGEGGTHTSPLQGMKRYGPVKRPEGSHFQYFFIYFENDGYYAEKLHHCLCGKNGSMGINQFTRLTISYARARNIVIHYDEDAESEVERRLNTMSFEPGVKYFAYYIIPHGKSGGNENRKRFYFRLKEMLLYRQVSMQAMRPRSICRFFRHARAGIGFAQVVRIGGAPFSLPERNQGDLIIGLNTGNVTELNEFFMGSAVCFTHDGLFCGAEVFSLTDTGAVAGLVLEVFESHPGIRRIIIHCSSYVGMESVEKMLGTLKPGIPVVTVVISPCRPGSLLVFGSPETDYMPPGGTWFRCGELSYLLYTGSPQTGISHRGNSFLPLKIGLMCSRDGYLGGEGVITELLAQVWSFCFLHRNAAKPSPLPVSISYPARLASFMPWFRVKMLPSHGRCVPWFV